ncbi:MAG: hypothetical protein M1368_01865, partial [Thaumarchaeota archaeon]|nr:hypothetical protein [Nitrososphaerota archaeon]
MTSSEGHKEVPSTITKPRSSSDSASHSLAYMNFKRSISYGKVYLIIGGAISLLLSATVASSIHNVTRAAGGAIVSEIPALVVPLAAVMGSLGGLMIFASDKAKGVCEYLIAYGVNISSIFWSIVLATVGLVSLVLVISVSSTFAILLAL